MSDTPTTVAIIDGTGIQRNADWMLDATGNIIPQSVPRANGLPVGSTNGLPIRGYTITPIAVNGSLTLGASGVPQGLQTASASPGVTIVICNPATSTGQGLGAAESIYVDAVTTAQNSGGSTSIEVPAGNTLVIGPTMNAVSWIATTGGHRIGAYVYI